MGILAARKLNSLPGQAPVKAPYFPKPEDILFDESNRVISIRSPFVAAPVSPPATCSTATQATLAARENLERRRFTNVSDSDPTNMSKDTPPPPPTADPGAINFTRTKEAQKDNKTLWALGLATVGCIATSLVVHLTDLLGDLKKSAGLLTDSISIFLFTCFGAGLLSLKDETIDSSDHTYSN